MGRNTRKDLILEARININGTVTIPAAFRNALGLELGGRAFIVIPRDQERARRDFVTQKRGQLSGNSG